MAMQLRSGRRLAASPVLRRVRRPRRSSLIDGKDRISSLPKDMRLEVLARLPHTWQAMRTSVLSSPWRRLWTELRDLTFDYVDDLDWLLSALAQVQPKLNRLRIEIPSKELGRASISSLLHAADKLEPLELVVRLCKHRNARRRVVLPCFARATSMELDVPGLRFKLPPTGSFASLERLTLSGRGIVIDPGAFLPRCPCLRVLKMNGSCPRGAKALAVESSSLNELVWRLRDTKQLVGGVHVHVVAPNLEDSVLSDFKGKFTMSLSAPKLEKLFFECSVEDYIVGCVEIENEIWRLSSLKLAMKKTMAVPGIEMGSGRCGRQHILSLSINNVMPWQVIPVERSIEEEVARLPVTLAHFSALELHLGTRGHVLERL